MAKHALVLQTDFGLTDRFVASMKGVALGVDPTIRIHDLTHLIEPYNTWQAGYVLAGTIAWWPKGTVFVSVVDPGVGTERKSIVVQTSNGHFIVSPDNGTLTLVADRFGIAAVREIDEKINRLPGSGKFATFHGRDVYTYTGARLAAGVIGFAEVGPVLGADIVRLDYQQAQKSAEGVILGNISHVEKPYGNIVTNIPKSLFDEWGLDITAGENLRIQISRAGDQLLSTEVTYAPSFGYVSKGEPLIYPDSEEMMGLAINQGNFSAKFGVKAGEKWRVKLSK